MLKEKSFASSTVQTFFGFHGEQIINDISENGKKYIIRIIKMLSKIQFTRRAHSAELELTSFRELCPQIEATKIIRKLCIKFKETQLLDHLTND